MTTLEVIAVIVGILAGTAGMAGFFLSIVSLWYQWNTTRPRLVVRPIVLGAPPIVRWHGMMEVRNVGHVPVVCMSIGFLPGRHGDHDIVLRETTSITDVEDGLEEIKPQHAAIVLFKLEQVPQATEVGRAYARTMVGDTFKASRRGMRRFTKRLKEARLGQPLPAAPCTPPQAAKNRGTAYSIRGRKK